MSSIRTVLAATDLSAHARDVVTRAGLVAHDLGARLALTHVVNAGALDRLRHLFGAGTSDIGERVLDEVRGEVRELADEIGTRFGLGADVHLAVGSVLNEIAAHADAIDADLLVLGAHGASPVREWGPGSTTERVLRKTRRPVLMVRRVARERYCRVLVPVDFSVRSLAALRFARALAPAADLFLLHAFEVPFEGKLRYAGVDAEALTALRVAAKRDAMDKMGGLIAEAGLVDAPVRRIVLHGDAPALILAQEQDLECDLVVIGKRGLGMIEEMLLGSVTKHILSRSVADVLVTDWV